MTVPRWIRTLFTVLVYGTAIVIGGGVLTLNPTGGLLVVPIASGGVLIAHALRTGYLAELGYAIMWLWIAVLLLSVGAGVVETIVFDHHIGSPLGEVAVAQLIGTLGLCTVLTTAYLLLVARSGTETALHHAV